MESSRESEEAMWQVKKCVQEICGLWGGKGGVSRRHKLNPVIVHNVHNSC